MTAPIHVYEIFIRAGRSDVWQALTDPAFTKQYFHQTSIQSDFESGSGYRYVLADGSPGVEGTIEEVDPPNRLVMTWRVLYDAAMAAEPPSRVEWTLTDATPDGSVTRVTLRHRDLGRSPLTWENVRLGWVGVTSGLKTLLETGTSLGPLQLPSEPTDDAEIIAGWHRLLAAQANNSTWDLLDPAVRDEGREELLRRAYAASYHWARAADRTEANSARADWLLSRVWAVLGDGDQALRYGDRCLATCTAGDASIADFDHAFAHEARARALACLGRLDEAADALRACRAVRIAHLDDQEIVADDVRSEPWFGFDISAVNG